MKVFKLNSLFIKIVLLLFPFLLIQLAYADVPSLGVIANNISDFIGDFAKLGTALCFAIGFGFGIGAIIKYKAHRDNPQYITLSTPVTLLVVCIVFLLLGILLILAGQSIFGPAFQIGS